MTEVSGTEHMTWSPKPESVNRNNNVTDPTLEQQQMAQMKLTREEVQALRECNTESFWYRCVPFSFVGIAACQFAVNKGILKPHPRFGALLKNMGAALVGYLLGKMSYHQVCKEKIMQLQNSSLADQLRKQKYGSGYRATDTVSAGVSMFESRTEAENVGQPRDDFTNHDIDTNANIQHQGLDDNLRPSMDNQISKANSVQTGDEDRKQFVSYDELRRQNRNDFNRKSHSTASTSSPLPGEPHVRPHPPPDDRLPRPSLSPSSQPDQGPEMRPRRPRGTNLYGDTLD